MAGKGFKQLLAEADAVIDTITAEEAIALHGRDDVLFVDVRESDEAAKAGQITNSVAAPRGFLEFQADAESPMHNPAFSAGKRLVLYCASGGRSTLAAKTLDDMGIDNVCHIAGGFAAWREAGGPVS